MNRQPVHSLHAIYFMVQDNFYSSILFRSTPWPFLYQSRQVLGQWYVEGLSYTRTWVVVIDDPSSVVLISCFHFTYSSTISSSPDIMFQPGP